MTAVAIIAAVASACSVDGQASRSPGLEPKAVAASTFPYGPAVAVPPAQVPGAIADITFRPLHGVNDPADCTPAQLNSDGASIRVGPGGPAGGTLTVLVAHASDDFDSFVTATRNCPDLRLGGTVGTRVATTVLSDAGGVIETDRVLANADGPFAHVYGLVAQRGDVRVYVQNRRGTADLSDAERAATRTLFDQATAKAFAG